MLISIIGIDGCGKGIQISFLKRYLDSLGKKSFISKAYGETEKEMFALYLENSEQESILFVFEAFHVRQRISAEKALAKGKIVIADRWDESFLAYHRRHGELSKDPEFLSALHKFTFRGIIPDITFMLDVSYEAAKKRCEARGQDFFDRLSREYHESMCEGYLEILQGRSSFIINGERAPQEIHADILANLPPLLKRGE